MLLIPCPYCGMERPELEFRYGGEAHIVRPADPGAVNDADWAGYLYFRSNPQGRAGRALAPASRAAGGFSTAFATP